MSETLRTFGYICPHCGQSVMESRSVFALASTHAEIACPCGKSTLHIRFDGQTYELEVPCGICSGTHTAVCEAKSVLRDACALSCAETKQFCCFIGPEGIVERHLQELSVLLEKEKGQEPSALFSDSVIMYEVLSELKEIAARPDGITCRCGSREYSMQVRRSHVDLICRACGAKLRLGAATDRDLDDLCCRMTLTIPGEKGKGTT